MNTEEMKDRFEDLYKHMSASRDVGKMRSFGEAARQAFNRLVVAYPMMAKEWLDNMESIMWNNYLTPEKAKTLAEGIVNQDRTQGPKWSMDTFFSVVQKLGGKLDEEPYYNRYALWLVANSHYSDFAISTAEDMGYSSPKEVPAEKMALSMYKKAVESLKDVDKVNYIGSYYQA